MLTDRRLAKQMHNYYAEETSRLFMLYTAIQCVPAVYSSVYQPGFRGTYSKGFVNGIEGFHQVKWRNGN